MKADFSMFLESEDLRPVRATDGSAGWDLKFNFDGFNAEAWDGKVDMANKTVTLMPLQRGLFPTGVRMAFTKGIEFQVRPRSGNALKLGLGVVNSPGTIDSDYRGDIGVILINLSRLPIIIKDRMRIAQGVFAKYENPPEWNSFSEYNDLHLFLENTQSDRGEGGFGLSDKKE